MLKRNFKTPPMGWNSYDYYDTSVTENDIRKNAEYMARELKSLGYEYVVVDIQWYAYDTGSDRENYQYLPFSKVELDGFGRLMPCPEKFPSSAGGAGFRPLADYVHSLGLKFGIHIMRGIAREAAHRRLPILGTDTTADTIADPASICGWNPDMYGVRATGAGQAYYNSIIELYASWGVDFIKCDDICNTNMYKDPFSAREEIEMLTRAVESCGREIALSLSPGPALIEKAWFYEEHANMWRITDDFWDMWEPLKAMFRRCELWQSHVSEGNYPDCDMLPLGKVGFGFGKERDTDFTRDEQRTMVTLWCIFRSPLMLGCELTKLDPWTKALITNKDVLDLCREGNIPRQLWLDGSSSAWASRSEDGVLTVALFNISDGELEAGASVKEAARAVRLSESFSAGCGTELWTGERVGITDGAVSAKLPPHGCAVFKLG